MEYCLYKTDRAKRLFHFRHFRHYSHFRHFFYDGLLRRRTSRNEVAIRTHRLSADTRRGTQVWPENDGSDSATEIPARPKKNTTNISPITT